MECWSSVALGDVKFLSIELWSVFLLIRSLVFNEYLSHLWNKFSLNRKHQLSTTLPASLTSESAKILLTIVSHSGIIIIYFSNKNPFPHASKHVSEKVLTVDVVMVLSHILLLVQSVDFNLHCWFMPSENVVFFQWHSFWVLITKLKKKCRFRKQTSFFSYRVLAWTVRKTHYKPLTLFYAASLMKSYVNLLEQKEL